MENFTILNVFNLLPSGLHNSEIFKNGIENALYEDGHLNAHEVLRTINITTKLLSEVVKSPRFKDTLYHEMSDKKEIYNGYTITQKHTNKFSFETCEDDTYNQLVEKMEGLKNQIKQREQFLKAIPEDGTVNPDTGEIINKAESTSTLSFTVNFKKPKLEQIKDNHLDNIFK